MATDLGAALDTVAQLLTDALSGLPDKPVCVTDERDLRAPGVLIGPDTIDFDRLDAGTATVAWTVWLVERDNGPAVSLTRLFKMLSAIAAAGLPAADVQARSVLLPNHGPDPLPGLTFTLTTTVTED